MIRCRKCVMPNTRPDTPFREGICAACWAYSYRPQVNWDEREARFMDLLTSHRNDSGYDCIVPSSGGKDSHYQALEVIRRGFRPLVVTATTCHLTPLGRRNIDNLARYAGTLEVTPNRTIRHKLNRIGLETVGDISWPEHVAIFTTPFNVAVDLGIPLIIYGENPQNQYGGPPGSEQAHLMTRRWVSEFGGFLGMRPSDLIGQYGIHHRDLLDYCLPPDNELEELGVEAHFLGQYVPWDSHRNAQIARDHGMIQALPSSANYWDHENLDNAQTGLHDFMMFRKYGYGRGCAQISVDIRADRIRRDAALDWVKKHDHLFPYAYAGVPYLEVLEEIGVTDAGFAKLVGQFTDHALMRELDVERWDIPEGVR